MCRPLVGGDTGRKNVQNFLLHGVLTEGKFAKRSLLKSDQIPRKFLLP